MSYYLIIQRLQDIPDMYYIIRNITTRWEFIIENKKVRKLENKNSTKKAIKKTRKQELDQESDQEN